MKSWEQPPSSWRGLRLAPRPSAALTAYRTGAAIASQLPGPVSRGLAEGVGVAAARLPALPGRLAALARRRDLAARHLRRVYGPGLSAGALHRRVEEAFASYGRYWAESLRLPSVPAAEIKAGVTYEGFEHIAAGEAAGRGTILALPHLGGWDWAGTQLALTGHPISVVVEALDPPDVFEWFVSFRERLGMEVITAGPGAAAACTRALASNHLLCLLCDRLVGGATGTEVEFFGERTRLPAGPVTLALRTGAALLPCAVYFGRASETHLGAIRPPLALARRGRLRDDVQAGTQVLAGELEHLIRRAPTQWHLMQPNWPGDPAGSPDRGGSDATSPAAGTSGWGWPGSGWGNRGRADGSRIAWPLIRSTIAAPRSSPAQIRMSGQEFVPDPSAAGEAAGPARPSRWRSATGRSPARPVPGK
jgi:KDO2-lipid IV(A) lauroyltransferase